MTNPRTILATLILTAATERRAWAVAEQANTNQSAEQRDMMVNCYTSDALGIEALAALVAGDGTPEAICEAITRFDTCVREHACDQPETMWACVGIAF